jgi:hypothetical protein
MLIQSVENQSGRMEMGGSEGSDLDELQLGGKYSSGQCKGK